MATRETTLRTSSLRKNQGKTLRQISDQAQRLNRAIQEQVGILLARAQNARTVEERDRLKGEISRLENRQSAVKETNNRYVQNIYHSPVFEDAYNRAIDLSFNGYKREAQRVISEAMSKVYHRNTYARRKS